MGPLGGVRVLDLSIQLAGPYASLLLADMGAEVIRIEPPRGDDDRHLGVGQLNGDSLVFVSRSRNKKSLTLNLGSVEGQEIYEKLVRVSDVVLENHGSPIREKLRLNYSSLKDINPRIIVANISGYGSWGPRANEVAFDPVIQAISGTMMYNGFPDDERPSRAAVPWVDFSTAVHAALGIMFALWHREKTGEGQQVDISLYDTAMSLLGLSGVLGEYLHFGIERQKLGNNSPFAYGDTFQAKDGWIFINAGRDSVWKRFLITIGREDLQNDPRFNSDPNRVQNRKAIDEIISPWVAERTIGEISAMMRKARVPCQKVYSLAETLADPHLKAREMLVYLDYPGKGKVPVQGTPIKLSASPSEIRMRAPLLAEHNAEILAGLLGYTPDDVTKFKKKGII